MTLNTVLISALEVAAHIAGQRTTGNGGTATILQTVLAAYKSGHAGSLAKHVARWQAERTTGELQ